MDLTNKRAAPRISMVHVHDPRVRWSVLASQVVRIAAARGWSQPVVDTAAILGCEGGEREESGIRWERVERRTEALRVVVVQLGEREIALLAAGPIDIAEVDPGAVLPLPPEIAVLTPHIAGIIAFADASLSLLVEPSAVTPSVTPVTRPEALRVW